MNSPNPLGISPVLLDLGFVKIHWYSIMYILGYIIGWNILKKLSKEGFLKLTVKQIDSYINWLIIGMLVGARLFYVVFWDNFAGRDLIDYVAVWQGGLSFHGAVVGMCLATYFFAHKHKLHFFEIADSLAVAGTIGLFCGRMGNFINGELYGRLSDVPWAMVFPLGGPDPRHPSQLYEGFFEGIVLFTILFTTYKKFKFHGITSSIFLLGYGIFRFVIEYFREPPTAVDMMFGGAFTVGQVLCLSMVIGSGFMFLWAKKLRIATAH